MLDLKCKLSSHTFETSLCEKFPKGFEKYFKQGGATKNDDKSQSNDKKKDEQPPSNKPKHPKISKDWNLGLFSPNPNKNRGSSSGGGQPIGNENPDKEKWMIFGAIGTVAFIAILAYFEMGYKEIGWKEFINK